MYATRRAGGQYQVKKRGDGPILRGGGSEDSGKEAKGKARAFSVGHGQTLLWRGTDEYWLEDIQAADGLENASGKGKRPHTNIVFIG